MTDNAQTAILTDHPPIAHHLAFDIAHPGGKTDPAGARAAMESHFDNTRARFLEWVARS